MSLSIVRTLSVVVSVGACSPATGHSTGTGGTGAVLPRGNGGSTSSGGASLDGTGGSVLDVGGRTGNGEPPSDAGNCGSVPLPSEQKTIPGNLLVLFDQSQTMGDPWTDATGATVPKHAVARDAIRSAVTPLAASLNAGALFFPTTAASFFDLCTAVVAPIASPPQILIEPGSAFLPAWDLHFAPPWSLVLGTPLNRALDEARAALKTGVTGTSAVVIITDGQWTCVDGTEQTSVKALFDAGVRTYIVGLPGSAGTTGLDQLASAGGTAKTGCSSNCFLLPTDGQELEDELSHIVTTTVTVSSCVLTLEPPPPDAAQVHLVATDVASGDELEVLRTDPAGDGWNLSADARIATITGTVCTSAKSGTLADLHFEYGCVNHPPLKPPR